MPLKEYSRKRNFAKTAEPRARRGRRDGHRFVVHKHAATRLHYDFRLEMNGTLKSWAVPKGIPFARGEKRLAVQVEDHPVDYFHFEGTIPNGQYGGGTVMVWDHGTFETLSRAPVKDLASGKLHFSLEGIKLHGEWHLVRLRDDNQWLLIRGGENMRPVSIKQDDTSALSGKTMKQISEGNAVWRSNRKPAAKDSERQTKRRVSISTPLPRRLQFIEPMQARLTEVPPKGDWIYEIKFDGFRALALKEGDSVRLLSRNEKDLGGKFPEVVDSVAGLPSEDAILDGEIVALDSKGRSSFQLLQAFELGEQRPPLFYYVFDLLRLEGEDLRSLPQHERKARLATLLKKPPGLIRHSAALAGNAATLLKKAKQLGLEGLIGKRADSAYEAGRRSGAWIKLKLLQEQEFIIGGYTNPEGTRKHFGALLVGVFDKQQLRFCGKVGTGFDEKRLKQLFTILDKIQRDNCPFANVPELRAGRYGAGLTKTEMRRCHWIEPKLVCQVKFSEWTRDAKLRQPVYLGLREDKDPTEIRREKPA
jgi:bifunctional non-homologous end joining protein LigD